MGKSVSFNVDRLIKKLDLIEKVHVPKAAEQQQHQKNLKLRAHSI